MTLQFEVSYILENTYNSIRSEAAASSTEVNATVAFITDEEATASKLHVFSAQNENLLKCPCDQENHFFFFLRF